MRQKNRDCVVIYKIEIRGLNGGVYYDMLQTELSGSSVIVDVCLRCLILIFRRSVIGEAEMQSKIYRILEGIPYELWKVSEL